jgi:glycine oxidase
MHSPDVVIAGAGLIGLACALECERRGLRTVVLERGRAMQQASWAAAGMLAAHDPANPPALTALAQHSIALYPAFLERVAALGGIAVPFETEWTLEQDVRADDEALLPALRATGFRLVREHSLNPRGLGTAVLAAVRASSISLLEDSPVLSVTQAASGLLVQTTNEMISCGSFADCTGAWSEAAVRPAKGQMLRVHAPGLLHSTTNGNVVVRTDDIYLVPRLDGSIVIGATVEDAGFDKTVHEADLSALMQRAIALLPAIADALRLESWAGLRPDTPDHLPLLGRAGERSLIAAGHFRNGVLLAPTTACIIAQMLMGEEPGVSLDAFAPARFLR